MARKRGSTPTPPSGSYRPGVSSPVLPPLPRLSALDQARSLIRALEDRRTWHPAGSTRPAGASSRNSRRIVQAKPVPGFFPPRNVAFSVPRDVAICVRRKTRREVIFAKRKYSKGAGASRRRSWFSKVGC